MDTGLLKVLLLLVIYFTPSILAAKKKHHYTWIIYIGNAFFGWTVIGWFYCLGCVYDFGKILGRKK